MNKTPFKIGLIAASIAAVLSPVSHASISGNTFHSDFRDSVKIDFHPTSTKQKSISSSGHALQFLKQNREKYALETNIDDLRLSKVKSSLTAEHYYFQQFINGVEVDKGEIIVSVSKQNKIIRVFNNTFPVIGSQPKVQTAPVGAMVATEKAWGFLQVSGKLHAKPKNKLVYINVGANFTLAYKVNMATSAPQGDWEFYIDAQKGDILRAYRIDLPISKNANEKAPAGKWQPFPKNKNKKSLSDALAGLASTSKATVNAAKVDATGLVFDPDPRTTLNNSALQDNSPAISFDSAYFNRTLRDVEFDGSTYSLTGPWVMIEDWDPPATAPSTNTTGIWNAKRGDNAFNDAMSYFHIDQNQRYIQSLGFAGATGIQFDSIGVDTDGHDGADQSTFTPSTNKLSFGHGCVDDNEDADVILHEYGHAINFSINPNWGGGDTGAMGEGFGDYWAFSYSYSTPNGQSFHPEWVFSWDGHGDGNSCWGGRQVDRTTFRYDPTKTYDAHVSVNGQNGNEVWSTPLAQSLIQLMNAGVNRSEVDQIILEAQFGLGSDLKMPDMAASIVSTASRLFPGGQHATIFNNNFKMMNVLGGSLEAQPVSVINSGGDTFVSPGETVSFNIPLKNKSSTLISQISTVLSSSSTGGVIFNSASSNYPNLAGLAVASNQTPFELSIPVNHSCGNDIVISMPINYTESSAKNITLDVLLPVDGNRTVVTQASSSGTAIPDNNTTGITDQLTVSGATANSTVSVDMNITHTWRGDLTVTLTSPVGTTVVLHNRVGSGANNIMGNYPDDLSPAENLSAFEGEDHNGIWSLKVVDGSSRDIGTLNSWALISTSPALCLAPINIAPVASVASPTLTVIEGDNTLLDASGSSDANGDVLTYFWIQTSGVAVSLANANTAQARFIAPDVNTATALTFEVTVSDPDSASDTVTVNVAVNDSPTPTPAESGGGGSFGWIFAGLLTLRLFLRKQK